MADGRAAAGLVDPPGLQRAPSRPASRPSSRSSPRRARAGPRPRPARSGRRPPNRSRRAGRRGPPPRRLADAQAMQAGAETAAPHGARSVLAAQAMDEPPSSTKIVEAGAAAGQIADGFVLSSPGMIVNFIMFSLMTAGIALDHRAAQRDPAAPHDHATAALAAHRRQGRPACSLLTFFQQILLIGVGAALLRRRLPARPGRPCSLMMVSLSLVACTLGLLLASLLTSEQALIATTVLVSMGVAALSGAWFPLEITGRASSWSATCCRRRGSWTACAASCCAGSTWPTCCPRSSSRSRGRRGSSCWPSRAFAFRTDPGRLPPARGDSQEPRGPLSARSQAAGYSLSQTARDHHQREAPCPIRLRWADPCRIPFPASRTTQPSTRRR